MPKINYIVNLPGFTVQKVDGYNPIIFEVVYRRKASCPRCGGRDLRTKDSFVRKISHEVIGTRRSYLKIKSHKYYCRGCGKYFNEQFAGIGKYQRSSENLKEQLCKQHLEGISQNTLSKNFKVGKATIERWYHEFYYKANQERENRECPRIMGIDEHSFGGEEKFVTTLCNLGKHKVFDIARGRSKASLDSYLKGLKGRENVKVVCMDLSVTYKRIVKEYFPKAMIVADRFHVIRLLNQQTMTTLQQLDGKIKYQRGILGILRTKEENLKDKKRGQLEAYFKGNEAAKAVYEFKERVHKLLMHKGCNPRYCRQLLTEFLEVIKELKSSGFKAMQTLGKTLYAWREEIVRMWRFSKSNGITEGFHRKMKLIQRRAYGFRSFDNYRLRVRALCG